MSTTLDQASAPTAERPKKSPVRGRRRILIVTGILLSLLGGTVAESGVANAAPPPGQCIQWCGQPPSGSGITNGEWDAAEEAANWWSNNHINWRTVVWYQGAGFPWIEPGAPGWPGANSGGRWFGYNQPGEGVRWIYFGGRFNDRNGDLSAFERNSQGASRSQVGQNANSPYVEYDIDYWRSPGTPRNARRIVRNSITGNTYATFDHYRTWNFLGRF